MGTVPLNERKDTSFVTKQRRLTLQIGKKSLINHLPIIPTAYLSKTPAISGSIMIRPQYSHTMIFLQFDIHLLLWWNLIEATAQAPPAGWVRCPVRCGILAYTLEGSQQSRLNGGFCLLGLLADLLFGAFVSETMSSSSFFLCSKSLDLSFSSSLAVAICSPISHQRPCSRMCFSEVQFPVFKFYLLREVVIFLAVTHIVELLGILLDLRLAGLNLALLQLAVLIGCFSSSSKLLMRVPKPAISSSVGYFQWQFTTKCLDTVNL